MVLFREDEERMKAQERQEKLAKRTPLGRWVRRIVKIALVLTVIFWLGLSLLTALGGNHPSLERGIEDYLTQATGYEADVGTFTRMSFFPDLSIDAGNITLRSSGGTVAVTAGGVLFSTGFFDLMFSRRRLGFLQVKDFYAEPGVMGEKALTLDFLGLKDDGFEGKPAFIAQGRYGKDEIDAHVTMEKDKKAYPAFILPQTGTYSLRLGDMLMEGTVAKNEGAGVKVKIDTLQAPDKILSGEFTLRRALGKYQVNADIAFGESTMQADIKAAKKHLEGKIHFPALRLDDLVVIDRLHAVRNALPLDKPSGLIDLYAWVADLAVEVVAFRDGEAQIGSLQFPVTVQEQELIAGPLAGTIMDGALSGRIFMDAKSLPAAFSITADIKGWDLGGARADLHADLESESRTYAGLSALAGDVAVVAGEGALSPQALDVWQDGLGKALFNGSGPLALNCMVVVFTLKDGKGAANPFFIDTAEMAVNGSGTLDLVNGKLAIKRGDKAASGELRFVSAPALADAHPCRRFIAP